MQAFKGKSEASIFRSRRAVVCVWLALAGALVFAAAPQVLPKKEAPIAFPPVLIQDREGKEIDLYRNSFALLIGVSEYAEWPKLPGVVGDIEEIRLELLKNGFQVTTVMNPDKEKIESSLADFIRQYGHEADSRLLFYFAGHGHTIRLGYGGEMGYIVPVDTPNPNYDRQGFMAKAIDMRRFDSIARSIECKHVLFLFDSCFSGSIFALSRAVPESISYKTAKPVRQFITSGSAEEMVPDKSFFKAQFLAGIRGEADNDDDGFVTGTDLGEFLQKQVVNYSEGAQHPQYGKIRDELLDKGDFVFCTGKGRDAPVRKSDGDAVSALEIEYWRSVKDRSTKEGFEAYLKKYPAGAFLELANQSLAELESVRKRQDDRWVELMQSARANEEKGFLDRALDNLRTARAIRNDPEIEAMEKKILDKTGAAKAGEPASNAAGGGAPAGKPAPKYLLDIISQPPGAAIFINGQKREEVTPAHVGVDEPKVRLKVEKESFRPFEKALELKEGVTALTPELEPLGLATLVITSSPATRIEIDGKSVASRIPPQKTVEVTEGAHVIKFIVEPKVFWEQPIVVRKGEVRGVHFNLDDHKDILDRSMYSISAFPRAGFQVDDRAFTTTPPLGNAFVEEGPHTLSFTVWDNEIEAAVVEIRDAIEKRARKAVHITAQPMAGAGEAGLTPQELAMSGAHQWIVFKPGIPLEVQFDEADAVAVAGGETLKTRVPAKPSHKIVLSPGGAKESFKAQIRIVDPRKKTAFSIDIQVTLQ